MMALHMIAPMMMPPTMTQHMMVSPMMMTKNSVIAHILMQFCPFFFPLTNFCVSLIVKSVNRKISATRQINSRMMPPSSLNIKYNRECEKSSEIIHVLMPLHHFYLATYIFPCCRDAESTSRDILSPRQNKRGLCLPALCPPSCQQRP